MDVGTGVHLLGWSRDAIEHVASHRMVIGQAELVEVVRLVTTHANLLHDAPRGRVAGDDERDDLGQAERSERVRQGDRILAGLTAPVPA